ncbi:MAG TPA: hypothetical protein VIL18_11340, partial [Longimicrobiales bacterium]
AISVIAERARARLLADTLALQVDEATELRELGGQVMIDITAASPSRLAAIAGVVQEEVARFASTGPSAAELEEARAVYRSRIDQELATLAGKALLLGVGELLYGDPASIDVMLRRAAGATAEDVRRAAREWLADGAFVLEFVPEATA